MTSEHPPKLPKPLNLQTRPDMKKYLSTVIVIMTILIGLSLIYVTHYRNHKSIQYDFINGSVRPHNSTHIEITLNTPGNYTVSIEHKASGVGITYNIYNIIYNNTTEPHYVDITKIDKGKMYITITNNDEMIWQTREVAL